MIRPSYDKSVPLPAFAPDLFEMLQLMAHASSGPLGGFCCTYPAIITKAGEGNAVWSACIARVSEILTKHRKAGGE